MELTPKVGSGSDSFAAEFEDLELACSVKDMD
jgi:hypothetical protein